MLPKCNCHQNINLKKNSQNPNVTKPHMSQKAQMSQKLQMSQKAQMSQKTQMSPKCKCHKNPNVTNTQMHQNTNVIETQMSPDCKCFQNPSVAKTQMSLKGIFLKPKCH